MDEGTAASRPKRRCSSRTKAAAAPSAVHYVGYVEEDETPEAIMKKFEELDRVKAAQENVLLARLIAARYKYVAVTDR